MDMRMDVNFLIQGNNNSQSAVPASVNFTEEDFTAAVQLHEYWNDAWAQDLANRKRDAGSSSDETMSETESHSELTAMEDDIPSLSYSVESAPAAKADPEISTPGKTQRQKKAGIKTKANAKASCKPKASNKSKAERKSKTEKASSPASKAKAATKTKASNANNKQSKPKTAANPKVDKNKVTKPGKSGKGATSPKIRLILKPEQSPERSN
ncbi:hypothetical protein PVAR5_3647 [Paecilomyces variotii No. 5]|uniref:Uncharacterized protein n=1 Tax=Byssochlamys spectabilis (strain No. 5 / NBRC 109023) TaxID=1356009 RepID=V5FSK6_BYSSN|nr:hypothetical protein PVAR5_3647 [Paecilomyces variotii No. 5]